MFSTSAISATVWSSTSISMQGTSRQARRTAARQRRLPAIIIQRRGLPTASPEGLQHALVLDGFGQFREVADLDARLQRVRVELTRPAIGGR